jgi:hypothetical protein
MGLNLRFSHLTSIATSFTHTNCELIHEMETEINGVPLEIHMISYIHGPLMVH